jgi:tRNA threonylcarbamoyladenosine biosynthesis protein TsaE
LVPGDVVALAGELGAGKTCFVQGAAAALGVTDRVTSPTFVIARRYAGTRCRVVHVDVYRLDSLREVEDLGYEDVFAPDAITFVEWADAVEAALPEDRLDVTIERGEGERRSIEVRAHGARWHGTALA